MMKQEELEYWLKGPLPNITAILQPVAHALLQAQREITISMEEFDNSLLWENVANLASPAFHLQHIIGVLDRLFSYADGKELIAKQLEYLSLEGKKDENITVQLLLNILHKQIQSSIEFLRFIKPETLTEVRYVGRKRIPSTQLGLLFHAAEHTMRHTGQLLVTAKVLLNASKKET